MYEETIAGLRKIVQDYKGRLTPYMRLTICKAADAIETLIGKVKYLIDRCDMADKNCAEAVRLGALWKEAALEQKPRWIPVAERLPLRGDAVLCVGDNGISLADFVCGDKWCALPWFYVDGEQETGVTHWMPLPEPPKEET